ncbi:MAG: radical SAM protein [Elusimicrobiota bacterium]|jgi:MoaA/NifB/PqqE/SkfB family radical SAM enzyme|nr:radical SAM protein [Elusimicrobiota bacterium]
MKFQLGQDLLDVARGKKRIVFVKKEKEFFCCPLIMESIDFSPNDMLTFCCFQFNRDETLVYGNLKRLDIDKLSKIVIDKKKQIISQFKRGSIPLGCRKCVRLKKAAWDNIDYRVIKYMTFGHFTKCNLKCSFCSVWKLVDAQKKKNIEVLDSDSDLIIKAIKQLHSGGGYRGGMLAKDFYISLAGGEPTLYENLGDIINLVIEFGGTVIINSNGARFVESFAKAIKIGKARITFSPDAGSREVYKNTKGADYFGIAWDNIKKYIDYVGEVKDDRVRIKFILHQDNIDDIENMVDMCVKSGAKSAFVDINERLPLNEHKLYKEPILKFKEYAKQNNVKLKSYYLLPNELKDLIISGKK